MNTQEIIKGIEEQGFKQCSEEEYDKKLGIEDHGKSAYLGIGNDRFYFIKKIEFPVKFLGYHFAYDVDDNGNISFRTGYPQVLIAEHKKDREALLKAINFANSLGDKLK